MSCKDKWQQEIANRLAAVTRVAAAQVDGAVRCDHPSCPALVNLATSTCMEGHCQQYGKDRKWPWSEVMGLQCLLGEQVQSGHMAATYVDDPRVVAAQRYVDQEKPSNQRADEVLRELLEVFGEVGGLEDDPRFKVAQLRVDPAAVVAGLCQRKLGPAGETVEVLYEAEEDLAELCVDEPDWEKWPAMLRQVIEQSVPDVPIQRVLYRERPNVLRCPIAGWAGLQSLWRVLELYRPTPPSQSAARRYKPITVEEVSGKVTTCPRCQGEVTRTARGYQPAGKYCSSCRVVWVGKRSGFKTGSGQYQCWNCGKETRDTGAGEGALGLCRACQRQMEEENARADGSAEVRPEPMEE